MMMMMVEVACSNNDSGGGGGGNNHNGDNGGSREWPWRWQWQVVKVTAEAVTAVDMVVKVSSYSDWNYYIMCRVHQLNFHHRYNHYFPKTPNGYSNISSSWASTRILKVFKAVTVAMWFGK